jgi:hypothetical protein
MDYNKIGHESLAAFVRTIQKAITNNEFEFIVTASDSGQLAAYITENIYWALNKNPPSKFIAPIYRHVNKERTILFDNTVLAAQFAEWQNTALGNILFVDDEIWRAATLNGVLDLLLSLDIKLTSCTIVAEDGGFNCPATMRGIRTTFLPSKQRLVDIYNAFSYTVPYKFQRLIKDALEDEAGLNDKQVMCTLLSLPIKEWNDGNPRFTERLIKKTTTKIPNFNEMQKEYKEWLKEVIQKYLSD